MIQSVLNTQPLSSSVAPMQTSLDAVGRDFLTTLPSTAVMLRLDFQYRHVTGE